METSHTHKAIVSHVFNGTVTPMITVYHRSFKQALDCPDCVAYVERHQVAHGMYADCLQKTIEAI